MKLDNKAKKIAATIAAVGVTALAGFGGYTLISNMVNDNPNPVVTTDNTQNTNNSINITGHGGTNNPVQEEYKIFNKFDENKIEINLYELERAFPLEQLKNLLEERNIPNASVLVSTLYNADIIDRETESDLVNGFRELMGFGKYNNITVKVSYDELNEQKQKDRESNTPEENIKAMLKGKEESKLYDYLDANYGIKQLALVFNAANIRNIDELSTLVKENNIFGSKDHYSLLDIYCNHDMVEDYEYGPLDIINLDIFNDYFPIEELNKTFEERNIHSAEELVDCMLNQRIVKGDYYYSLINQDMYDKIIKQFELINERDGFNEYGYADYTENSIVEKEEQQVLFKGQEKSKPKYHTDMKIDTSNFEKLLVVFDTIDISNLDDFKNNLDYYNIHGNDSYNNKDIQVGDSINNEDVNNTENISEME